MPEQQCRNLHQRGDERIQHNISQNEHLKLFGMNALYGIQPLYFEADNKKLSQFDQYCEKIIQIWSKPNPSSIRQEYRATFTIIIVEKLITRTKIAAHLEKKLQSQPETTSRLAVKVFCWSLVFNRPSMLARSA